MVIRCHCNMVFWMPYKKENQNHMQCKKNSMKAITWPMHEEFSYKKHKFVLIHHLFHVEMNWDEPSKTCAFASIWRWWSVPPRSLMCSDLMPARQTSAFIPFSLNSSGRELQVFIKSCRPMEWAEIQISSRILGLVIDPLECVSCEWWNIQTTVAKRIDEANKPITTLR